MPIDFELLKKLSDIPGPSGFEDDVRALIQKEIEPFVDRAFVDPMGNLIAIKGNHTDVLFDAHMDEVGFMITGVMKDGSLHFHQIGSVPAGILPGKRVLIGKNRIPGVIASVPLHLQKDHIKSISYDALRIFIGAESEEEAVCRATVGDFAVFDTECKMIGTDDRTIAGRNMDDRLGCYLLIRLLQKKELTNCVCVFSVLEESGCRGAAAAAEEIDFRYAVAIDTTSAANVPGVKAEDQVCALRKGGALSFIDRMATYDNALIREIYDHLIEQKIPIQAKGRNFGGTNASAYMKTGTGHYALSLSTPALYIHGPLSVVAAEDICSMEDAMTSIFNLLSEKIQRKEGD